MSYQLELRHYRYFMALAEECHFHKAAERLFISQPGLSRQIKQMEETLDIQLFARNNRKVALTHAGKYLQNQLTVTFSQLENIHRQLRYIQDGESGEIRIGFLGSAMQKVIPELLVQLKNNFPKIQTSLEEMSNNQQLGSIINHQIDIGFVRLPNVPKGIIQKDIYHDRFVLVIPEGHVLNKKIFKSISQVALEAFILFSSDYSPYYYDTIISICTDAGFTPRVTHKTVHAQTIFKLVEQGLGIAIVPHSLQFGFDLGIRFLDIPDSTQTTTLSAIWSADNSNPCIQNMITPIEQMANELI